MKRLFVLPSFLYAFPLIVWLASCGTQKKNSHHEAVFKLADEGYFQKTGSNVMVFSNLYGLFGDEKMSGIQIVQHGVRTATNGDVRLDNTPEQWDEIPTFKERVVDSVNHAIEALLEYPKYNYAYSLKVSPANEGIKIQVNVEHPLPEELEGRAGFNLESLPSAYFEKSYIVDGNVKTFPLYTSSNIDINTNGKTMPTPLSAGRMFTLAPEDDEKRMIVSANNGEIMLFDGRDKEKIKELASSYKSWTDSLYHQNPYGVQITTGGWAGNGTVIRMGINSYALYKAFPDIFDKEDVLKSLNYLYGCHPGSNISFVSAIGTQSKKAAYGMNRADYSFIAVLFRECLFFRRTFRKTKKTGPSCGAKMNMLSTWLPPTYILFKQGLMF